MPTFRTRCRTICRARVPRRRCKSLAGKDFGLRKNAFYGLFVRHRCRTKPPKEAYDRKAAQRAHLGMTCTNRSRHTPCAVPILRHTACAYYIGIDQLISARSQRPLFRPLWPKSPIGTMFVVWQFCLAVRDDDRTVATLRCGAIGSGFRPCYTGTLHHAEVGSSGLPPQEIPGPWGPHSRQKGCATSGNYPLGAPGFLSTESRLNCERLGMTRSCPSR